MSLAVITFSPDGTWGHEEAALGSGKAKDKIAFVKRTETAHPFGQREDVFIADLAHPFIEGDAKWENVQAPSPKRYDMRRAIAVMANSVLPLSGEEGDENETQEMVDAMIGIGQNLAPLKADQENHRSDTIRFVSRMMSMSWLALILTFALVVLISNPDLSGLPLFGDKS